MAILFRKYPLDTPVDVALVGSQPKDYDKCMHCLSDGNWWCFRSRKAWLVLDCTSGCVPCSAVTIRATNKDGCPGWVTVEALESECSCPKSLLETGEVTSEQWKAGVGGSTALKEISGEWSPVVSKQPLVEASEDSTFTVRFPEETSARFWKVTLGQESGDSGWMGINRIRLLRSGYGVLPVMHPRQPKLVELLDQIIGGERAELLLDPGNQPGGISLLNFNAFALYGTPAERCCEGLEDVGVAVALEREGFNGRVAAFSHNNFFDVWKGLGPGNRVRAKVFFSTVAWAAGASRAVESTLEVSSTPHSDSQAPGLSNLMRALVNRTWPASKHRSEVNATGRATEAATIRVALLGGIADHVAQFATVAAEACPEAPRMQIVAALPSVDWRGLQLLLSPNSTGPSPHVIVLCNATAAELIAAPNDKRVQLLTKFVAVDGGGFVTALCPWGWNQVAGPDASLRRCLPNHILLLAGLVFNDSTLRTPEALTPVTNLCSTLSRLSSEANACECTALQTTGAVATCVLGNRFNWLLPMETVSSMTNFINKCAPECIWQLLNCITLKEVVDFTDPETRSIVPEADWLLHATLGRAITETLTSIKELDSRELFPISVNSVQHHISRGESAVTWIAARETQPLQRVLLGCLEYSNCLVSSCPEAAGIESFPGRPKIDSQSKQHWSFDADLSVQGWQFAGCYVPPGVRCTIHLLRPQKFQQTKLRLRIQLGCHSDKLQVPQKTNQVLRRWPQVTVSCNWEPFTPYQPWAPVTELRLRDCRHGTTTEFASPFGGLLYLEVMNCTQKVGSLGIQLQTTSLLPAVNFNISSTETPYSANSWRQALETGSRAPWGEIQGRNVIITLPYSCLQLVQDAREVIKYWDDVVTYHLDLCDDTLSRKERIVCDEQLSAGYMHSGYPVMLHLDMCKPTSEGRLPPIVDLQHLRQNGNWGIFHELGHNRQKTSWTFTGTTEVTVNLFSLHAYFKILGQTPLETVWFKSKIPACVEYLSDKSQTFYNTWCAIPGVALGTYACYIERYGFEPIRKTLRAYKQLTKSLNSNTLKITEWVIQTSMAASVDLRPYYDQWRWPYDQEAAKVVCSRYAIDHHWDRLITILRAAA